MSHPYASHTKEQLLKRKTECEKIGMPCPDIDAELKKRELEESINLIKTDIKKLTKPHWTLVPIFWIALVSILIALTSLVIGIVSYLRPAQPVVQEQQRNIQHENSKSVSPNSSLELKQKKSISHNKDVQVNP
jgi:hypothetical protein